MHDVGIFVMEIEQIDLVSELGAVERALLHQRYMKAVGIGIDDTRPHATGRALAADDEALDAQDRKVREQRRALERAGALLPDHDIGSFWRELVIDRVGIGPGS